MTPQPLTRAQLAALEVLVRERRLDTVPADARRARAFMSQAHDAMDDVTNLAKPQNQASLAYDGCHDIGEALMAAYGFRTRNGNGQHEAVGRFMQVVLDSPPGDSGARRFERLRRTRNRARYEARPSSAADAHLAARTLRDLWDAALRRGITS